MNEHNFNELITKELPNRFRGSERKKTVVIDRNVYLLKLPDPVREKNRSLSYINNSISEYLGCHILKSLGFEVQETLLGTYYDKDKNKTYIACACKDICTDGYSLGEIADISLSDESYSKYAEETTLSAVHKIAEKISKTDNITLEDILSFYYDLLIADLLIGNTDRHNRNWGILTHPSNPTKIAPVFDCGSSLSPLLSDEDLDHININNIAKDETTVLHEPGNKRYKWLDLLSINNEYAFYILEAAKRIIPRIDINKIHDIIDNTPYITDKRKDFYKSIISIRYEQVLLPYLDKSLNKDIIPCKLDNPYEVYKTLGLNNLNIGEELNIENRDVYLKKVSNRYALIHDIDGSFKDICPIRSNNDDIRKMLSILKETVYTNNKNIPNNITREDVNNGFER